MCGRSLTLAADRQIDRQTERASFVPTKKLNNMSAAKVVVGKPPPRKSRNVHKASFVRAQKNIKKDLGISHKIQSDAIVSMGRCLDETGRSVVSRWAGYALDPADAGGPKLIRDKGCTLTGPIALHGLMTLIPLEKRAEVSNYINDSLDAFYGVRQ